MGRVVELSQKVKELQQRRDEVETKVVPLQPMTLTEKDIRRYMSGLQGLLATDGSGFADLLAVLDEHHCLRVDALDRHRVRVSLTIDSGQVVGATAGGGKARLVATVTPRALLEGEGSSGSPLLTAAEWAAAENAKGHLCACGCGGFIKVRPEMRAPTQGITTFIHGHHKMDMTEFVEALNAEGFLTVSQAAKALGVSENTMRRAEGHGWIKPQWRTWGARWPMRIYAKADLSDVREQMVHAGFRFQDDEGILTTAEMAAALGVSETHLRYLERRGVVPAPERDTANMRKWLKANVPNLRKAIASRRKDSSPDGTS